MDFFEPKYLVTLDEIYHSHWAARKRRRIRLLREAFDHFWPKGHPTKLIQITGTNGKGSVAHYLEQGLAFAGKTGSWTGPHVFDYAERFHIEGEKASHAEITQIHRELLAPYQDLCMDRNDGMSLTFAELGILLALYLFARHGVVWAVMEVGAGGRYTPLMALPMTACVLTNVGNDHPKSLGDALWQRALEKAGIAREDVPFFTSAEGEALDYVTAAARAEGAPVLVLDQAEIDDVAVHLDAPNQPGFKLRNTALACKLIRHFYSDASLEMLVGRMKKHLPGRFTQLADNVLVDVAHNQDKIGRFAEQLRLHYPDRAFHFLLGLTRSRDPRKTFGPLLPLARRIVFTGASYAGQKPEELAAMLAKDFPDAEWCADPAEAYRRELANLPEDALLVLTGSAYMIDQAVNPNPYIKKTNASYGRRYNQDT
ncbi:MAG: Mur ligase family protein [Acidobacteriota bacterium]|nr:Mur ligase family protein [Acidobacteriota bacterium]